MGGKGSKETTIKGEIVVNPKVKKAMDYLTDNGKTLGKASGDKNSAKKTSWCDSIAGSSVSVKNSSISC
jgi:hypothetical protein